MTIARVRALANNRLTAYGAGAGPDSVTLSLTDRERRTLTVDWSDWLQGDTVAAASSEATGVSVEGETASDAETALTIVGVSMAGFIRHTVTTAAGQAREITICLNGGQNHARPRNYC